MIIVARTRLTIRDQNELLNQIAGTYKDFYRAAMEYIDNAVDAATILQQSGVKFEPILKIHVDTLEKKVSFTDNCEGMSPQELCELLSEVGRSKKKAVPWANGQFGFGVHAFRAFAKEATFISRKRGCPEARIRIDRAFDENKEVPCEKTDGKQLNHPGTRVIISRFDPQVFKKNIFVKALVSEIEHHFDDVLRAGLVKILVTTDGSSKPHECQHFNFETLPGIKLEKEIPVHVGSQEGIVSVDIKILDRSQDNRLPILTNKRRRVQTIADLKSYKNYLRDNGEAPYVWSNPFVVGYVEIYDLCSPNLTRDDLRDSPTRDVLYEHLLEIQRELQVLVDESMNKKAQDSLRKLGNVLSDCLSRILRGFKLQFEQVAPSGKSGEYESRLVEEDDAQFAFGGDESGGGGPGPDGEGSGGQSSIKGNAGPGQEDAGGGKGPETGSKGSGKSEGQTTTSPGPHIEFQNHAGEDRVIDLGGSLIINIQHPDFIQRNTSRSGKIKLDARLLNYVSLVIAPPCVHRLFEKRGKVPTALEVGKNVVDLSVRLESELITTVLGEEIEKTL